jgi:hypothetical protein
VLTLRYVGGMTEGVAVDALGVVVFPGETVEVEDDAIALNMAEQTGTWEPVSKAQATRKAHELEDAPQAPEGSD